MPIHIAIRAVALSLATAAFVLTMLVLARDQTRPLVIVVESPPPSTVRVLDPVSSEQWSTCWDYDRWNRTPADPRWWCGLD
jgi:hypothetical protein